MQEIFAERKTSRTLKIVMEAGFEPKKSPSGVISYINTVFVFFHLRNVISEYEIVVLMFFIPFGTNYINPASANMSTMKIETFQTSFPDLNLLLNTKLLNETDIKDRSFLWQ